MAKQQQVTRRDALLAASGAAVLGFAGESSEAGGEQPKPTDADSRRPSKPLRLEVTLTDGQTIELNAKELLIDFGTQGRLVLKPEMLTPAQDGSGSENAQSRGEPFPAFRRP